MSGLLYYLRVFPSLKQKQEIKTLTKHSEIRLQRGTQDNLQQSNIQREERVHGERWEVEKERKNGYMLFAFLIMQILGNPVTFSTILSHWATYKLVEHPVFRRGSL